jgi:hypothetical protein
MSAAVTVVMFVGLWRARASRRARVTSGLTITLTVVLLAWTVVQVDL